jgi:hypothetical protein
MGEDPRRSQHVKLIAASVVLGIALLWIALSVAPMVVSRPRAKELDSPAWRSALDLNQLLLKRPEFADTMFDVVSEKPMKLRLVGGVYHPDDVEALRAFIQREAPDLEFEMEVEVLDMSETGDTGSGANG